MTDSQDVQVKLQLLRESYARQLPAKLQQIELIWQGVSATEAWDEAGYREFYRLVHSMTGSGKTFGYPELSVVARELEDFLKTLLDAKVVPDPRQTQQIVGLLRQLNDSV